MWVPVLATLPMSAAEPGPADKRQYHLFNPTPREILRPLTTDRPDVTESPITVDAGRFQVEMDIVNYTRDDEGGVRSESFVAGSLNLKAGLLHNVDLQVIVDSYVRERTRASPGPAMTTDGFGDITTRLKINLWGNDGDEQTALGVMPFLKVPTASGGLGNDSVEGGLIVPFAFELPAGWSVGVMAEFDFLRNTNNDGYHTEFVNTVSFGHDIVGDLAGYVELVSVATTETGADWRGFLSMGLTYGLCPDSQLDLGVIVGMNRAAEDMNPFLGFSFRY
jgi:Putative MetA-pathway of phenol degradation